MNLQLSVKSTFRQAGDMLEVLTYLYDSSKVYHPEKLLQGKVDFLAEENGGEVLLGSVDLTKYHGTADGSFRAVLLHPSLIEGLHYKVEMRVEGDVILSKSGVFEVIEPTVGDRHLVEQPDLTIPSSAPRRT